MGKPSGAGMTGPRIISATAGSGDDVVEVSDTHFEKPSDPSFYEPAVCLSVDRKRDKDWASSKTIHLTPDEARTLGWELIGASHRAELLEATRKTP